MLLGIMGRPGQLGQLLPAFLGAALGGNDLSSAWAHDSSQLFCHGLTLLQLLRLHSPRSCQLVCAHTQMTVVQAELLLMEDRRGSCCFSNAGPGPL